MKRNSLFLAAAALLWMGASRPAAAQAQVFSDQATWSAAAGTVATRDFQELTDFSAVESLSYDGVTFSSSEGTNTDRLVAVSDESLPDFPTLHSRMLAANLTSTPLISTFSPSVRSVGMDVVALFGNSSSLTVTVVTGDGPQQVDVALSGSGPSFIGFIADSGITSVTVSVPDGDSDNACVDNVSYGGNDEPDPGNPVLDCLDELKAVVEAGIADGSIKNIGNALLDKVATARAYAEAGDLNNAAVALNGFKSLVKAQCGKKISKSEATELLSHANECLDVIAGT
jgi:hypothetical protein